MRENMRMRKMNKKYLANKNLNDIFNINIFYYKLYINILEFSSAIHFCSKPVAIPSSSCRIATYQFFVIYNLLCVKNPAIET